jgi:hypothetical protein
MTGTASSAFTEWVDSKGWGVVVTVPGHPRGRWLSRLDLERLLILIGAVGVLATVAVALWGQA